MVASLPRRDGISLTASSRMTAQRAIEIGIIFGLILIIAPLIGGFAKE